MERLELPERFGQRGEQVVEDEELPQVWAQESERLRQEAELVRIQVEVLQPMRKVRLWHNGQSKVALVDCCKLWAWLGHGE